MGSPCIAKNRLLRRKWGRGGRNEPCGGTGALALKYGQYSAGRAGPFPAQVGFRTENTHENRRFIEKRPFSDGKPSKQGVRKRFRRVGFAKRRVRERSRRVCFLKRGGRKLSRGVCFAERGGRERFRRVRIPKQGVRNRSRKVCSSERRVGEQFFGGVSQPGGRPAVGAPVHQAKAAIPRRSARKPL